MVEVEDESVQLVVTSPPYNCGMDYGCYDDSKDFNDYLGMLSKVWQECERVLVPGGRIAVNVSHGNGRRPYMPLGSYITLQIEQFFQKLFWCQSFASLNYATRIKNAVIVGKVVMEFFKKFSAC